MSHLHRLPGIFVISGTRCTFIESHHDISSDGTLNVHNSFRSKQVFRTVNVRAELNTFFAHLADAGEREHLKASTVGQHRAVKAVELV